MTRKLPSVLFVLVLLVACSEVTSPAAAPEHTTTETPTTEAQTAEAQTAEAQTAEAQTAEAQTAEAQTAEAQTAEAAHTEAIETPERTNQPMDEAASQTNTQVSSEAVAEANDNTVTGCSWEAPVSLPIQGIPAIASAAGRFFIAGHQVNPEEISLSVFALEDSGYSRIAQLPIPRPEGRFVLQRPALAVHEGRVAIAWIQQTHRLMFATFDATDATSIATYDIAQHASDPTMNTHDGAWLLAWTDHGRQTMRVFARKLNDTGEGPASQNLTPPGAGATAPTFMRGTQRPTLLFVDARGGISLSYRSVYHSDRFTSAEPARPIRSLSDRPELAAVYLNGQELLAYTAVGRMATSAVGWVNLETTELAQALVPGEGYGVVHTDVALYRGRALFVANAPSARAPTSPRELRLRILSEDGLSPALVSPAPATRARIAADDTSFGVVYREAQQNDNLIGATSAFRRGQCQATTTP